MNSPIGTVVVVMSPSQRPRQPRQIPDVVALVDGQRAGGRMRHRIPAQRIEQHGRAGGPMQQRRHELSLIDHPVQVGTWGGAGADVAERVAAVELLTTCGQVDAGERVADRFGRAHGHSADRVDHDGETVEPDLGVVVEPDPGGLLDGLRQQRRPAFGERRIDLVLAVAGNRHVGVPRDGHHRGGRARPDARERARAGWCRCGRCPCRRRWPARPAGPGSGLGGCPSRPAARSCPCRWRAARGSRRARGCGAATSPSTRRLPPPRRRTPTGTPTRGDPNVVCGEAFSPSVGEAVVAPPAAAGAAADRSAAEVSGRRGGGGGRRWGVCGFGGHAGGGRKFGSRRITCGRLPARPGVGTRGLRPVVVHSMKSTTASRGGPPPARSRRRRPSR